MLERASTIRSLTPIAGALIWKAWFALEVHGDMWGMNNWLERAPECPWGPRRSSKSICLWVALTLVAAVLVPNDPSSVRLHLQRAHSWLFRSSEHPCKSHSAYARCRAPLVSLPRGVLPQPLRVAANRAGSFDPAAANHGIG